MFDLALEYDADPSTRQQAAEAYDRVIALDPQHVEALVNRGMIAFESGDLESAVGLFRRAVAIEPDHALAHYNLGCILDDMGLLSEARQQLRLATPSIPATRTLITISLWFAKK